MPHPKQAADPVLVFAAGKSGVQTLSRALAGDEPAVQLAAARMAAEAATRLPEAIDKELRASRQAGTAARAAAARRRT